MGTFQVAVDGPAGAGKSTIAKMVAAKENLIYVDTGAMYRAVAVYFLNSGLDFLDSTVVEANCKNADVTIKYENGIQVVYLNGENVNHLLRTEETGNVASKVSSNKAVRAHLFDLQQKIANGNDCIMDGRDIGTVILPDAPLKVYLTASSQVRAKRRYDELKAKGENPEFEMILEDIEKRDYQDMHREISPLTKASDAELLDSSDMTIDEVVAKICSLIEERR